MQNEVEHGVQTAHAKQNSVGVILNTETQIKTPPSPLPSPALLWPDG